MSAAKVERDEANPNQSKIDEMKAFGVRFSKEEWAKLCEYEDFMNIITEDIKACRILAEKILAGKWNGPLIKDRKKAK